MFLLRCAHFYDISGKLNYSKGNNVLTPFLKSMLGHINSQICPDTEKYYNYMAHKFKHGQDHFAQHTSIYLHSHHFAVQDGHNITLWESQLH